MANDAATMTSTIPARALRMETETPFRQLLVEAIDLKHQRLAALSLPIGKLRPGCRSTFSAPHRVKSLLSSAFQWRVGNPKTLPIKRWVKRRLPHVTQCEMS
jgi:hypothetical protein